MLELGPGADILRGIGILMWMFIIGILVGTQPRYGIAYEDLATPEERTQWIAGSAFRVLDLQTNEVLAERIGYFMDEGMGATGGSRSPWSFATAWSCPSYFIEGTSRRNWDRNFTEQVLKIRNP